MFVYVWVGLGFFLSLLTSSYDAINMFFHATTVFLMLFFLLFSTAPFLYFCSVSGNPLFTFYTTVNSDICHVYVCLLPPVYTSSRMFDSPTLVSPNTVCPYMCYM